ncbi:26S protease regulatory subunit 8, putative [Eimeria brunetti]|uniref:26S protease regulatory subunit 8, putative n=1 Tax=Eimeria brunetti TaxID=51314 RepID=U6LK60_9EIME|nr:26S protease regulatory subunit 8, putative [Eimeria brunetti]
MKVEKVPDSTYEMVGGLEQQIKEVKEGVLLYGPPGTGKTLVARAVAHHTECTFIRVSGGELVQKYIGEGSRMVRELFVMARQHAPSIIFMDEIDSIGAHRATSGEHNADSEVQRTMMELLNQLDGFESTKNIKARTEILKIHSRKMNLVRGIDLKKIAQETNGASGAEAKAVCTEAGMFALRERRMHVTQEDFEMAVAKV